jgi:hypothetical protein
MSIEKVHLRKLLQLFFAKPNVQRRILLDDIRMEERRENGELGDARDFYGPFWFDAKEHVAGRLDLRESTKARVADSKARRRLYPLLAEGFLQVWEEKIRWKNEPYQFHAHTAKGQFEIEQLNATIKVENVLTVKIWDGTDRAVYPYFSEQPILPIQGVQLGFWALKEALPNIRFQDLRIMDVLRGAYFRPADAPLQGNERDIFVSKYQAILKEWHKLRSER